MGTTGSRDHIEAASSEPLNKRRRFSSTEADDHVVEVPQEPDAVKELLDTAGGGVSDNESDDDAAPEVLSSKDAARQARGLPNRSLRHPSNKRRRTAEEHLPIERTGLPPSVLGESKAEDASVAGAESLQLDAIPLQNQASTTGILQQPDEDPEPLNPINAQNEVSNVGASQISDEAPGDVPVMRAQKPENAQDLPDTAKDAGGYEAPSPTPEPSSGFRMTLVSNEPEEPMDSAPQTGSLEGTHRYTTDEVQADKPRKEPQPAVEPGPSPPGNSTAQLNVEAQQQTPIDTIVSQTAEPSPTPSMPEADSALTRVQKASTTSTAEDQIPGTPQTSTSSVITPVWRTRTHDDTPLAALQSPSLIPAVKAARARSSIRPRHQDLVSAKTKPTSLQQYRDQLLNRHQRTADWGPPGFRKTKFVGA
ncbi:hypothetical protein PV04_01189 [Phialophora macrospora]|uniref:Uncharacterized protein n=1 Tax=Phialophora macrospora TaxID=1851006 RepID=A0A0D2EFH3_9EURO|nr:hypothetical protein PV04_01189 [Phialophora macrospora]